MSIPIIGQRKEVPVIGQPKVVTWRMHVVLKCPCGEPVLLTGQLPLLGQCTGCLLQYMIPVFALNEEGELMVQCASRTPPKEGE